MLNGMGRDRGAVSALDQAVLPETVAAGERTSALAWYNIVLDGGPDRTHVRERGDERDAERCVGSRSVVRWGHHAALGARGPPW